MFKVFEIAFKKVIKKFLIFRQNFKQNSLKGIQLPFRGPISLHLRTRKSQSIAGSIVDRAKKKQRITGQQKKRNRNYSHDNYIWPCRRQHRSERKQMKKTLQQENKQQTAEENQTRPGKPEKLASERGAEEGPPLITV